MLLSCLREIKKAKEDYPTQKNREGREQWKGIMSWKEYICVRLWVRNSIDL